jgi:hypothetical protein
VWPPAVRRLPRPLCSEESTPITGCFLPRHIFLWQLLPVVAVLRTRIRDPVLFLPPGSGIRDGAMVGSGSGISKQNLLIAFIQK